VLVSVSSTSLPDGRFAPRLDNRVRDRSRDQLDRPDRVIVAGDRDRDQIGIGVRVDDRDDRDAELVALADRDALLLESITNMRPGRRPCS